MLIFRIVRLVDTLAHHGVGNFHEAGDVCALHVVDISVGLCAVFHALSVDILHDFMEAAVNFFGAPLEVFGVLAHFET